uniref:Uncharacterized protein n=2 Tax=Clastoptera arizonana TaxID=38151 RepID=A0A1B6CXH0_9HEMI
MTGEVPTISACDFAAGWASGICGLVVGHPLDTIKVRQQILGKINPLKIAISTFKHEGIVGFYKGMMFPLLTAGTLNSIFFGIYGNTLRVLQAARNEPVGRKLCCEGGPAYPNYHWDVYYAGCAGGAATVLLSTPIELVKTQLQSQVGDKKLKGVILRARDYTGPWDCLRDIYRSDGLRGCFRGLIPMLWR